MVSIWFVQCAFWFYQLYIRQFQGISQFFSPENSGAKSETNNQVKGLAQDCLDYLDTRTQFWQQQKPMYARKHEQKMKENSRKRTGKQAQRDPGDWILKNLEEIDSGKWFHIYLIFFDERILFVLCRIRWGSWLRVQPPSCKHIQQSQIWLTLISLCHLNLSGLLPSHSHCINHITTELRNSVIVLFYFSSSGW